MGALLNSAERGRRANTKIPFRLRFKAWWEGYELFLRQKPAAALKEPPREPLRYQPEHPWETPRITLAQQVWGDGFSTPGGEDYILELVKPLGLTPAMSLIDLGAGLGGASRLMAEHFGVWVTGMEEDHELAHAGMELSTKAGMGKKAPIAAFDPDNFEIKPKAYDCVFSKEAFFTIADKQRLFRMIDNLLKDRGQLLFTDYVLAKAGAVTPAVQAWCETEPVPPRLWSVDDYVGALMSHKLDIRITEDITEKFRTLIIQAWASFLQRMRPNTLDPDSAEALVQETELWARRVQALESGDLKVCRIYALKKPRDSLLSDW